MTIHRVRIPLLVASGIATAFPLAGCGSSDSGTAANDGGGSSAAAPPAASSTQSGSAASGSSVSVTETEFHIALGSTTLKAGTYTFDVKNAGSITHALTVDGPGVEDQSTGDIDPGSSGTLTVTLQAGSYDVYCPVGDHKMEGMDEMVTVA